jgi:hypothetical protein
LLEPARVSGFITNRDRGSGLRVRASGFGVYIHKYIHILDKPNIINRLYYESLIFQIAYISDTELKLIARHCFLLFSIRQNKTEQNRTKPIVFHCSKFAKTEPNRTEQNQSAAIVSHCSRFGKINTMEYNGIPKTHKIP